MSTPTNGHPSRQAFLIVQTHETELRALQTTAKEVWDRRMYGAAANAIGRVRRIYEEQVGLGGGQVEEGAA